MFAYVAILCAFITGFWLYRKTNRALYSWLISCTLMPAFVFFAEFVLPNQGGGASLWPIALLVGTSAGALISALGILFAYWIRPRPGH